MRYHHPPNSSVHRNALLGCLSLAAALLAHAPPALAGDVKSGAPNVANGRCVVSFDAIDIVNQKSDSNHADNDWLVVTWFVGPNQVRTDKIPLRNLTDSVILHSGQQLAPIELEVQCANYELVSASYAVLNLGSSDFAEQAAEAEKFATALAKTIAAAYLEAAQTVVAFSEIPLADLFADGIAELSPTLVSAVGAAFEHVLIPLFNALVEELKVLAGAPNCNGDVLHDIVLFDPWAPLAIGYDKTYTSGTSNGCGAPARTVVHVTTTRIPEQKATFPTTELPDLQVVPAPGHVVSDWMNAFGKARDPKGQSADIFVSITPSTKQLGTWLVLLNESSDPNDPNSVTTADGVLPKRIRAAAYTADVWHVLPLSVGPSAGSVLAGNGLSIGTPFSRQQLRMERRSAGADLGSMPVATTSFGLNATGVSEIGSGLGLDTSSRDWGSSENVNTVGDFAIDSTLLETVDVLELPNGVQLGMYYLENDGQVVGPVLRYMRCPDDPTGPARDVVLRVWDPL